MLEVYLKIYGAVQGVGFRYDVLAKAQKLGLSGWVKNTASGSVEIAAQGKKEYLEKLVSWVKTGPHFARVENIELQWRKSTETFSSFEIK